MVSPNLIPSPFHIKHPHGQWSARPLSCDCQDDRRSMALNHSGGGPERCGAQRSKPLTATAIVAAWLTHLGKPLTPNRLVNLSAQWQQLLLRMPYSGQSSKKSERISAISSGFFCMQLPCRLLTQTWQHHLQHLLYQVWEVPEREKGHGEAKRERLPVRVNPHVQNT